MAVAAVLIFLVTLTLVIWQPRGLGIGWTALGGAVLALASTVVHPFDVPAVLDVVWNATLTFVAVVLISLVLDECGFFAWTALHVARWGRGNGRLLLVLVVLLGAVVSTLFTNDGGALILTPVVISVLRALEFPPGAALGYVIATGFIADTASLPLVVSNLVNIVSADFFDLSFARYAVVMVPVALVSVLASLAVLLGYFRRSTPQRYRVDHLPRPHQAIGDPLTFRAGWAVLVLLLVGYFAAEPLGVPLCVVAGTGTVLLLAVAARRPRVLFARVGNVGTPVRVARVVREAPWQIVLFSLGMYLVVYGLRNEGLTAHLASLLGSFTHHGTLITALGTGGIVAVLSCVMNNLPTVLIAALAIDGTGMSGLLHETMVYANVVGSDLGPKITPVGSLATLLWLHVLARKGIHIGWGRYFGTGIVLTLPVLAVTLAALAGWLTVLD